MRPNLKYPMVVKRADSNPRDTLPDDSLDAPETERDTTSQSYIALRQAVPELPGSPKHSLADLDGSLGARVLRLEVTTPDAGERLGFARALRAALATAGSFADPVDMPERTFEARMEETLRGVYAWAFGALDSIFLAEFVRPLPRRVWGALANDAEEAVKLSRFQATLAELARALRDARRACEGLSLAEGTRRIP